MLALDRRIPDNVAELRAGTWNKKEYSKARGLFGRTLGLLGYGNIGQEMARRAHAFGMPIVVWSRRFADRQRRTSPTSRSADAARRSRPRRWPSAADVLSVHLALTPRRAGSSTPSILEQAEAGRVSSSTPRAPRSSTTPRSNEAVRERGIRVGLDVFAGEPTGGDRRVQRSRSRRCRTSTARITSAPRPIRRRRRSPPKPCGSSRTYKDTGKVPNVVNLATKTPATHMLVVRHRDRPGVLAHVFDHLRERRASTCRKPRTSIFEGAEAAVARINLDARAVRRAAEAIQAGNSDILDLHLVTI